MAVSHANNRGLYHYGRTWLARICASAVAVGGQPDLVERGVGDSVVVLALSVRGGGGIGI